MLQPVGMPPYTVCEIAMVWNYLSSPIEMVKNEGNINKCGRIDYIAYDGYSPHCIKATLGSTPLSREIGYPFYPERLEDLEDSYRDDVQSRSDATHNPKSASHTRLPISPPNLDCFQP
jgi:hypothetical protein